MSECSHTNTLTGVSGLTFQVGENINSRVQFEQGNGPEPSQADNTVDFTFHITVERGVNRAASSFLGPGATIVRANNALQEAARNAGSGHCPNDGEEENPNDPGDPNDPNGPGDPNDPTVEAEVRFLMILRQAL